MKIFESKQVPEKSKILNSMTGNIDYIDSFSIEHEQISNFSIDYLTALLFMTEPPAWMKVLLKLRNSIAKIFGLKTGPSETQDSFDKSIKFSTGEKIGLFPVIARIENEIILAESDKHLSFWASVMKHDNGFKKNQLKVTTVVQFNNILGKLYFIPVKPFHKIIVKNKILSLTKSLTPLPMVARKR